MNKKMNLTIEQKLKINELEAKKTGIDLEATDVYFDYLMFRDYEPSKLRMIDNLDLRGVAWKIGFRGLPVRKLEKHYFIRTKNNDNELVAIKILHYPPWENCMEVYVINKDNSSWGEALTLERDCGGYFVRAGVEYVSELEEKNE